MELDLKKGGYDFTTEQVTLFERSIPRLGLKRAAKRMRENFDRWFLLRGYRKHKAWGWVKKGEPLEPPRKEDGTIKTRWEEKAYTPKQVREDIGRQSGFELVRNSGRLPVYRNRVVDYGGEGAGLTAKEVQAMF